MSYFRPVSAVITTMPTEVLIFTVQDVERVQHRIEQDESRKKLEALEGKAGADGGAPQVC